MPKRYPDEFKRDMVVFARALGKLTPIEFEVTIGHNQLATAA